ncbi:MAG: tRNA (adenosine(37)-N6)-dimethylallyltransferase MiaA [Chloroflexi bacterium]|nr:tRNA (adenosine(37)-N6)-dimethylallyltransferase MiaA [Chloroflexota bacterium]
MTVAIVGPTASGKSALALRVAEALGAEIISADSRQVYRGLDVGTAKPTAADRARVPHHLIDIVDPGDRYDVSRYQRDARGAHADIQRRGRAIVVVGGTGLYVRALLDELALDARPSDPDLRARLTALADAEGSEALHARLADLDPASAREVDVRNVRRLIRYLEVATLAGPVARDSAPEATIEATRVALAPPRAWLDARIDERARAMVEGGVLDEARWLRGLGLDPRTPSLSAHGYVHWLAHLAGSIDLETAIARTVRDTRAYARRQMTWFRADPRVTWIDPLVTDPLDLVLKTVRA